MDLVNLIRTITIHKHLGNSHADTISVIDEYSNY